MLHLTSGPALVVEAGLALFCLLDTALAPEAAVRWLPRWAWALLLLSFPVCGLLGWLLAGRPWRARARTSNWPSGRPTNWSSSGPARDDG